jgi:hypothetical protein
MFPGGLRLCGVCCLLPVALGRDTRMLKQLTRQHGSIRVIEHAITTDGVDRAFGQADLMHVRFMRVHLRDPVLGLRTAL